jgi:hypothetical protein
MKKILDEIKSNFRIKHELLNRSGKPFVSEHDIFIHYPLYAWPAVHAVMTTPGIFFAQPVKEYNVSEVMYIEHASLDAKLMYFYNYERYIKREKEKD